MKTLFTIGKLSVVSLFITSSYTPYLFANQSNFESDYFYAGAKVGSIRYQHGCEPWAINCDKRDTSYAGFIGYQFNDNLFLESSLFNLGEVNATYFESGLENHYVAEIKGWDLGLAYEFNLSQNLKPFIKAGFVNWHGKHKGPNKTISENDWSPTGTLGIKYNINDNWQARLSYQYIEELGNEIIGSSNGHIGWLGLSYQFKRKQLTDSQPIVPAAKPQQTIKEKPIQIPIVKEITKVVPEKSITTLFAFDSSYFDVSTELNEFLTHIKNYPTTEITIKAYTDSKGSAEYNNWLSKRRAIAIKDYLINQGIDESRISVAFFGETNPISDNDTEDHRQLNRRAVITSSEIEVRINKEVQ